LFIKNACIKNAFRSFAFLEYYYFNLQVLAGNYKDETGFVIKIGQNRIILLSDISMCEIETFPRDLQLFSGQMNGIDSSGQFEWGELVQLNAQTVGVIVQMDRETFHVLSMYGNVIKVRPQSITNRRGYHIQTALDSQENSIKKRDIVEVIDGPHAARRAEIKYLYRNFAFLYSRTLTDNSGMFVCKTRHLRLLNDNKANSTNFANSLAAAFMSPRITSPMHPSRLV